MRAKMEYLSHIISNNGIQTDPKKIESVHKARPPKNQKELQSFLGLASYYQHFIHSFSHITSPLSKLTSKQVKWKWTTEEWNIQGAQGGSCERSCPPIPRHQATVLAML
jgi:hypothetical protein